MGWHRETGEAVVGGCTASVRGLAVVAVCVGLVGCTPHPSTEGTTRLPRTQPSTQLTDAGEGRCVGITIFTPTGWYLNVRPDGSGQYGFGSSLLAEVPKDTFAFSDVIARMSGESRVKPSSAEGYSIGLERPDRPIADMRYTRDQRLIRELFDKAMAASPPAKSFPPGMAEPLLRDNPPVPGEIATGPATATTTETAMWFTERATTTRPAALLRTLPRPEQI